MSSFDPVIGEVLATQVPLRPERGSDWNDVLDRAGRPERQPLRAQPRTFILVALAAALVVVASALAATGHDLFGSLGNWLNGKPGTPASSVEQASFAARNAASYARFPAGTKLRRLDQSTIAGKSYVLLGFKSGESLCLELEPAGDPSRLLINECVTLCELDTSRAPALVAAESVLEVGAHTTLADSIVGFADDNVKAIEYRSANGAWQTTPVVNNVFLGLSHDKANSPRTIVGGPVSEIEHVKAVTTSGKSTTIPFVAGYVSYPAGPPKGPSYVRTREPTLSQLPGPTRATTPFLGGTIAWLAHHQPRGQAWSPPTGLHLRSSAILDSRAVQPDRDDPDRIGVFLYNAAAMLPVNQKKKYKVMLCKTDLIPLSPSGGWSCRPAKSIEQLFAPGTPFDTFPFRGGQQVFTVEGLAADQVASMKLFLGSGRVIPVSLTDNAFSVGAPTTQFPAKLVAYNAGGQVIGLQAIAGPAHPVACPTPAIWPASKLPPAKTYQRLDLANLTINGKRILGMTPAQVTVALGAPTRAAGFKHAGFGQPVYFYGSTRPTGTLLRVEFLRSKKGTRVVGLDFQGRGLTDTTLGHILNVSPQKLQHELVASEHFKIATSYGSVPAGLGIPTGVGCSSLVTTANGTEIDFGVDPYEGARPYIYISRR